MATGQLVDAPSAIRVGSRRPCGSVVKGTCIGWRRRVHALFFSFALVLSGDYAVAAPALQYERLVQPRPLNTRERKLLREVRAWGRRGGRLLRYDPRLSFAAEALLAERAGGATKSIDLTAARQQAQRWGCTDGQMAVVTLDVAAGHQGLPELLAEQLGAELGELEINRFGLATGELGGLVAVVALFSRRMLHLLPFPSRTDQPRRIHLGGTLAREVSATSLTLVVGRTDGTTEKIRLAQQGRDFDGTLQLAAADRGKVINNQILIDRGRGPEIAASFHIGVDTPPWPRAVNPPEFQEIDGNGEPASEIARLILSLRTSQDLPLPAQSTLLADIARGHARDMRDQGFFAHTSPTTGDVRDRLRGRGIPFVRALENIATAASVKRIMTGWLQSPSHRANLLDPEITAFGVGVVVGARGKLFAVAVLARLADDGAAAELAAKTAIHIDRCRARRGRAALRRDPRLELLAARHSEEMAGVGRLSDVSPSRGRIADTVFREVDVSEAAADVYVADSIDAVIGEVARSPHLSGPYQRVGVGLFRQPGAKGPQLWVTIIYAAD